MMQDDSAIPKKPEVGEVAVSSANGMRQIYIGELSPDPRRRQTYSNAVWIDDANTIQLYRGVMADDRVEQGLEQRFTAAVAKPWTVTAGGERPIDVEAADSITAQFKKIKFNELSKKMLHAVYFGYSIGEVIYRMGGARVEVDKVLVRAAERFIWDAENRPLLRTLAFPNGRPLAPSKYIVLPRPADHDDIPYKPGLARWCFWPAYLKRHGVKFWAVALEKFGTPTAKGTYRRGAEKEERDALLNILASLATGIAVTLPEDQDIELIEALRRSGGDYELFCQYMDNMITNVLLGQSSTTDQGAWTGTAGEHRDVRDDIVTADCKLMSDVINRTLVRWLTLWNHPGAEIPEVSRNTEPREDLNARATRDETIARITGRRPTKKYIEDTYGGEWEDAPAMPPTLPNAPGPSFAAPTLDPIAVASLEAARDWQVQMSPIVEPTLDAADDSDDLDSYGSEIDDPAISAEMRSQELERRLTNTQFSSAASGNAEG